MKLIALGDTHGRTFWKEISNAKAYDKLVFIGDYFDSKEDIDAELQIVNFLDICSLKRSQPDKVILLIGNHDYHYLDNVTEQYSDFQEDFYEPINEVLQPALDEGLLQVCYAHENILFTHAGLTKTWCRENEVNLNHPCESINELFVNKPEVFGYTAFYPNTEGISPLWVRPDTLVPDRIDHYVQVVGHTRQPDIQEKNNIYFIDTFSVSKKYLVIDNGQFTIDNL